MHNITYTLQDYIKQFFNGKKMAFARHERKYPQHVSRWLKADCIVHNGVLYKRLCNLRSISDRKMWEIHAKDGILKTEDRKFAEAAERKYGLQVEEIVTTTPSTFQKWEMHSGH